MFTRFAAASLILAAGCARQAPTGSPRPMSPPTSSPSATQVTDTAAVLAGIARQAGDTTMHVVLGARVIPRAVDSLRLDTAEITRRAAEVFGDSGAIVARPNDSASSAPSWDIEVHSYETVARVEHY